MSDPTPPSAPRSRRRLLLAVIAALIPIVPLVAVVFLDSATPRTATAATSSGTRHSGSASSAQRPRASRRASADAIPSGTGSLVGIIVHPTAMSRTPGGHRVATLPTKTGFGSPESVWVRRVKGRWLGVVNVAAGNHHLGWIRSGTGVELTRVNWVLRADLSAHQLSVYDHGSLVRHYEIATGKPTAPTPTGEYAVTDRLRTGAAEGPYGCCILALSANAPHAISDWDGGNRIAIHSYPITSTIGQSVSHGCMHVTDAEGEWLITHVPLGTPVIISSA